MKRYIRLSLFLLMGLVVAVAAGCRAGTVPAEPVSIALAPHWVALGDTLGAVDENRGVSSVESVAFSPDGQRIVSGAKNDGSVRVWDLGGRLLWTSFHENDPDDEIEVVVWSPDGRFIVSGGEDSSARVWRAEDGGAVRRLVHPAGIDGMAFSHSGHRLATGTESGTVYLWDTASPQPDDWSLVAEISQGPDEQAGGPAGVHSDVNQIDFAPDDGLMAVASRNAAVRLWRLGDGEPALVRTLEGHTDSIKSVRFSPDGRLVAAGAASGDGVRVWSVEGDLVGAIPGTGWIMEAVAFSPDGRFLITGGNEGEQEGRPEQLAAYPPNRGFGHIRAYRVSDLRADGAVPPVLTLPVFRQEYFDFTDDGARLVSGHEDGTVRLWAVTMSEE